MTSISSSERYILSEQDGVLTDGEKVYTIEQFNDWPEDAKPRERLLDGGPSTLTLAELLAVVLNVGTRKENVLTMTSRILKEYGERGVITETNPKKLAKELDLPITKACQVVACFELGKRLFATTNKKGPVTLRTPKQVYQYTRDMASLPKEHLRGLYLNAHNKLVHDEVISIGTLTANLIHPREVFQPALEHSAAAVILVHNHPSGSTKPSRTDIESTARLVEAGRIMGIDLLDHVIITKHGYASIELPPQ